MNLASLEGVFVLFFPSFPSSSQPPTTVPGGLFGGVQCLLCFCRFTLLTTLLSSLSNDASYLFLAKGWAGGDQTDRDRGGYSASSAETFGGILLA